MVVHPMENRASRPHKTASSKAPLRASNRSKAKVSKAKVSKVKVNKAKVNKDRVNKDKASNRVKVKARAKDRVRVTRNKPPLRILLSSRVRRRRTKASQRVRDSPVVVAAPACKTFSVAPAAAKVAGA